VSLSARTGETPKEKKKRKTKTKRKDFFSAAELLQIQDALVKLKSFSP
jgi:hypothetical protein